MNVDVDRLTLRLPGMTPADGRRLAQLVGEALASAPAAQGSGHVDSLRVTLDARPGEGLERLADRIAAGILRNLEGTQ